MIPIENYGVRCMSMGSLVEQGAALVWRGPMVFILLAIGFSIQYKYFLFKSMLEFVVHILRNDLLFTLVLSSKLQLFVLVG